MKRKKKRMSNLTRVLLCSWCVLMLVLTFFIIKWALSLPDGNDLEGKENIDAFLVGANDATPTAAIGSEDAIATATPVPTPTPTPEPVKAEFTAEYAHIGEMAEEYGYTDGVSYGVRFPNYEDEALNVAAGAVAQEVFAEFLAQVSEKEGKDRILLIDYEDGETTGLFSILFHVETEIDGVKETAMRTWIYNKKKAEAAEADSLFKDLTYKYAAQQVNQSLAVQVKDDADNVETTDAEGTAGADVTEETVVVPEVEFSGTREEFPAYVLTADGAKFYYEVSGAYQSIVIPYMQIHTYMTITENGTVVAEGIRELDPNKPMVALTFDDGPHLEQTPRLLKALEANGARATFFVLGDRVLWGPSNEKALKMIYESGNEVGSHTYSHKDLKTLSAEKVLEEMVKARNAIYSIIGEYPTLVRPPYGNYNDVVKANSYAPLINWNLDSRDWDLRNAEKVAEKVLKEVKDGKIILMHDIYVSTVEAAEILMPELVARGYQIVSVRELFYYKGIEPENGVVYNGGYK